MSALNDERCLGNDVPTLEAIVVARVEDVRLPGDGTGEDMYVVIAPIQVKAGYKDQFIKELIEDARGSVNDEPGASGST